MRLGFCINAPCNQTLLSSLHLISQGWEAVIWVISQTMVWNDPLYTVLLLLFSFLPADTTLVIYFVTNDCWNYKYTIWKQVQIYVMCSCGSNEQNLKKNIYKKSQGFFAIASLLYFTDPVFWYNVILSCLCQGNIGYVS